MEAKKKITADVKRMLRSVQYANDNIERIGKLLEVIRSRAEKMTTSYSDAPGGGHNQDSRADVIAKLVDTERQQEEAIRQWCQVRGDPTIYVKQKYWIPEDLFEQRIREDNVPYDIWHDQGYIDLSPGNKIDYRLLVKWFQLEQQEDDVFLYKLGYDRWSATYFVQDIEEKFGKPVLDPVAQGVQTLSAPMKALKADLAAKRINYGNNPVLKWCMANTSVIEDRNGNIQPCKMSGRNRIDGFASLLDAYVTFLRFERDYENII